jgi:hypothetical protein
MAIAFNSKSAMYSLPGAEAPGYLMCVCPLAKQKTPWLANKVLDSLPKMV